MKITITAVTNGWIVTSGKEAVGFSYDVEGEKEIDVFCKLLWHITESLGMSGSRYDKKRIFVTTKAGDKFEN